MCQVMYVYMYSYILYIYVVPHLICFHGYMYTLSSVWAKLYPNRPRPGLEGTNVCGAYWVLLPEHVYVQNAGNLLFIETTAMRDHLS